jgi:cytochrome c oxidase subunit III
MRGWASRRAIMSEPAAEIAHQFVDAGQQRDAATFGMWIFLCTEVLLFGALFLGYTVYRLQDPETFDEAAAHTLIMAGSINTAVVLVSSFCVAVAVHLAEQGDRLRVTLLALRRGAAGCSFAGRQGL